ncbi:MAG TPA: T9SS type A sorting domain-containing protein [Rhodothermales bacterium]|nr:T9SS type A sorting domain-containing protein [Rhodothermales bacterium]
MWANQPTASTYSAVGPYSYNGTGQPVHIERPSGPGFYTVTFEGMGAWVSSRPGGQGRAFVTAYGTSDAWCQALSPNHTGPDYQVTVSCYDRSRNGKDTQFTLLVLWPETELGTHAYAYANQRSAPSYTPAEAFNPNGSVQIVRSGEGSYKVQFQEFAQTAIGGTVQVTTDGIFDATCQVRNWTTVGTADLDVYIDCYGLNGVAKDANFAVTAFYGAAPDPGDTDVALDFEAFEPGTFLVNQLLNQGIRFPNGLFAVACEAGSTECQRARSSQNVGLPPVDVEFNRKPIELIFSTPQRIVALSANSAGQKSITRQVNMTAYNAAGTNVASVNDVLEGGPAWTTRLRIERASEDIKRIILTANRPGQSADNQVIVDDLFFEGAPPPPVDTTPPTATIPDDGATIEDRNTEIDLLAEDNTLLDSVAVRVHHAATGTEIYPPPGISAYLCGTTHTGACPATRFETAIPLAFGETGAYEVALRAVDAAGNTTTTTGTIIFEPPPPAPLIFVQHVELNQGVQTTLHDPSIFGTEAHIPIRILPGKDLVLRYYLFKDRSDPNPTPFSASLEVDIERTDGSWLRRNNVSPNAGLMTTLVETLPVTDEARTDTLLQQRADLSRTLNFIIPGAFLKDASFAQFQLFDGIRLLSTVQINNIDAQAAVLGLRIGKLATSRGIPTVTDGQIDTTLAYVRRVMPVSDVVVLSQRTIRMGVNLLFPLFLNRSEATLMDLGPGDFGIPFIGGTSFPLPDPGDVPFWISNIAFGSNFGPGRSGLAKRGHPENIYNRYGVPSPNFQFIRAISLPLGDVAAHELGHTIGFPHAGNAFGEGDGGDYESWPYSRGMLGLMGLNTSPFGTATHEIVEPSSSDAGQFNLTLIDPCPTPNLAQRHPECRLGDGMIPHEMMSYGASNPTNFGSLRTQNGSWISAHNYKRIYNAIRFSTPVSKNESGHLATHQSLADPVEAYAVTGVILPDGTVGLAPLIQRPAAPEQLAEQATGNYALELYNAAGALLNQTSFEPSPVFDGKAADKAFFRVLVPYFEDVASLILKKDSATLYEQTASSNVPEVRVLSPNGGERFDEGMVHVAWEGHDADGDSLTYFVQFTPDDGQTWLTLAHFTDRDPQDFDADISDLAPGNQGRIRVTASDGLNTTIDLSDHFFGVSMDPDDTDPDTGTAIEANDAPESFALLPNYPNPFNPATTISFEIPTTNYVRLEVFDILGRKVVTLMENTLAAGRHTVIWDSKNQTGMTVSSGVYLYRLTAGSYVATRRMVLLK